jgi:hypothetical protein
VVKYVQSPNRTVCRFDDDAVQLRQRAIDAANAIPGFDEPAVQSKMPGRTLMKTCNRMSKPLIACVSCGWINTAGKPTTGL